MRFVVALAFAAGAQAAHNTGNVCDSASLMVLLEVYFDAECAALLLAAMAGVVPETSPCDCFLQVPAEVAMTYECALEANLDTLAMEYAVRPTPVQSPPRWVPLPRFFPPTPPEALTSAPPHFVNIAVLPQRRPCLQHRLHVLLR